MEACLTRIFQALVDGKYIGPTEFGHLTGGLKPRRKAARPAKASRPAKGAKASPAVRAKPAAAARKGPKKAAARTARR